MKHLKHLIFSKDDIATSIWRSIGRAFVGGRVNELLVNTESE